MEAVQSSHYISDITACILCLLFIQHSSKHMCPWGTVANVFFRLLQSHFNRCNNQTLFLESLLH